MQGHDILSLLNHRIVHSSSLFWLYWSIVQSYNSKCAWNIKLHYYCVSMNHDRLTIIWDHANNYSLPCFNFRNLSEVLDLSRFRNLSVLWLNKNKVRNWEHILIQYINIMDLMFELCRYHTQISWWGWCFIFQLRAVTCLSHNFSLSNLYLQHNELTTISGCLQHLTCLQVLFLHNNQLEKLERVVHELRKMQSLRILSRCPILFAHCVK